MLAVSAMSPTIQAIFYAVAVAIFIIGAVISWTPKLKAKIHFVSLGLAVATFVLFWGALSLIH